MSPVRCVLCGVAAVCVTLAGCSAPYGESTTISRIGCEEAVAQAVAGSRNEARASALASLTDQIGELKGYMLSTGYRRVGDRRPSVDCHAYPLAAGLTQCVATARLCSR